MMRSVFIVQSPGPWYDAAVADRAEQHRLYEEARRAYAAALDAFSGEPVPGTQQWNRWAKLMDKANAALAAYTASLPTIPTNPPPQSTSDIRAISD